MGSEFTTGPVTTKQETTKVTSSNVETKKVTEKETKPEPVELTESQRIEATAQHTYNVGIGRSNTMYEFGHGQAAYEKTAEGAKQLVKEKKTIEAIKEGSSSDD